MNKPQRPVIALISYHADPSVAIGTEEAGGQNVYVREVGGKLAALGWQVDMFTRKNNPNDSTISEHNPHCRTIRLEAGPCQFISRDQLFPYTGEFIQAFLTWQAKQGLNYPLLHSNYWLSGSIGLELKKDSNAQLVHTYHSLGAIKYAATSERPPIASTRLYWENQILTQADRVIATSPQEEEVLRQQVSCQGKIEIIPCGADLNRFHPISKTEARKHLGWSAEEKVLLYVGRFDPRKGIETLIRSYADLQAHIPTPLRLVLVGGTAPERADSQEKARLEALIQELGLPTSQIVFAGQIDHDHLPLYYSGADVCVIPSYYEPFGLVAIEAMACGTPVVASEVGGLKFTVLKEETGLLVPPKDVPALTAALARIVRGDEVWLKKLQKQAVTNVKERFSWTGVGIQLSDLYRRLLAESITRQPINANTRIFNDVVKSQSVAS